ncbi:MAG: chitobiase/beta-hexosaminidase, partial [Deltaproteobacteria bacterium]
AAGPGANVIAQIGYGPAGTDPRTSTAWDWQAASFNVNVGNNDEYDGSFTVATPGSYLYTARFSLDGGLSFTYADLDGAGSNGGLDFSLAQLGQLTVN